MLHRLIAITVKELRVFFRDITGMAINFAMPLAFIVVMSFALSGQFDQNGASAERPIDVLVVNLDEGPRAGAVINSLQQAVNVRVEDTIEGAPLTVERAEALIRDRQRSLALVFPEDFTQAIDQPLGATERFTTAVRVIADPGASRQLVEPVAAAMAGLIGRELAAAVPAKLSDEMVDNLFSAAPDAQRDAIKRDARARGEANLDLPIVALARDIPSGMSANAAMRPNSFQQNVPGYTVFGVFWIVQQLALSVVRERRDGTFRRLLAAPVGKGTLLLGKLIPYFLINLLQVAALLGIVGLFFGLDLRANPLGLILVSVAMSFAATSLGVLVAAFGKSESQVIGMTTLLLIVLAALGGSFVPTFLAPDWMQTASLLTPHGWALQSYLDLLVRGYTVQQVLPGIAALCAFGVAFLLLGVWRFRFD